MTLDELREEVERGEVDTVLSRSWTCRGVCRASA